MYSDSVLKNVIESVKNAFFISGDLKNLFPTSIMASWSTNFGTGVKRYWTVLFGPMDRPKKASNGHSFLYCE